LAFIIRSGLVVSYRRFGTKRHSLEDMIHNRLSQNSRK